MATAAQYALTEPRFYVWWFPGSPVRVHLSLEVVRRLREELSQGAGKTAIQGLLYGRTTEDATHILDCKPVAGPIPESLAVLPEGGPQPLLVGCYRTEAGALRLNEQDVALSRTFFAHSYQVLLVIQPAEYGPPTASFFFHDTEGRMTEISVMEFPLESSLLAGEERDRLLRSEEAAARRSVARRPAPAAAAPRKVHRFRRVAAVLLGASVLGAIVTAGIRSWPLQLPARTAAAPPPSAAPLSALAMGLRAKRQNGDVEITWTRESPVIAAALSGVLSIQDGESRREIALDGSQVRNTGVLYSPSGDNISVVLAVTTPLSTVTESFMLLLPENQPAARLVRAPKASAERALVLKPFAPPAPATAASEMAGPALPALPFQPLEAESTSVLALMTQPAAPVPVAGRDLPTAPADGPSSNYRPAEPRHRVVPQLAAPLLATLALPMVIEVRVFIDRDGRVTRADGIRHGGVNAAVMDRVIAAARSWTFTPARRGDEPAPSEHLLQFRFGR